MNPTLLVLYGYPITFADALGAIAVLLLALIAALLRANAARRREAEAAAEGRRELEARLAALIRSESEQVRKAGDDQARGLRQELGDSLRGFQETTLRGFRDLSDRLENQVKEFGLRLDKGVLAIHERVAAIAVKLDEDIARMGEDAMRNRDLLRQTIEAKLDDASLKQSTAARELREEMTGSFRKLGLNVTETLGQYSDHQKERLENVTIALGALSEKQERAQEALKQAVENRLDAIRIENSAKLDEMRKTVDEKLQSTLEARLGESFNRVVEHLERVQKGIGEMQSLAAGVGDLKKVLSNVRVRGTYGEVQLAVLLEQFLSPEQYIKNAQVKENTQERVEFAIRMPGRDADGDVLLPVDAKFPQEDYERLVTASECGDQMAVLEASKNLEDRIRLFAKSIRDKYISPPRTTEFAILFLPTESLYAELLRRPGLSERLQREFHVVLTGPTTLAAFLNALQMGFRSLAIQKRSGEVWQILGAVSGEFDNYNKVVDTLAKQLDTAAKSVDKLGVRTRAMNRKLRGVEKLPDDEAQLLLGPALAEADDEETVGELPSKVDSQPDLRLATGGE
jgi:DNA recombination protein RmuC